MNRSVKNGQISIRNEQHSTRPRTVISDENVGRADVIIRDNRRIALARELDVSVGSARTIVTEVLNIASCVHGVCLRC